jgi:glycosyltransferase involved in cell wall biosynthesis
MNLHLPAEQPPGLRVLVFADRQADRYRAGRTMRALAQHGVAALNVATLASESLTEELLRLNGPVWLVRAGSWPAWKNPAPQFPSASSTGRPLCALGRVWPPPLVAPDFHVEALRWAALLAQTGGDLAHSALAGLQSSASVFFDSELARKLAEQLLRSDSLMSALRTTIASSCCRIVHHAPLDVHDDPCLRVVQVITSLQRGGAERVVLDLANALPRSGVRPLVVTLGRPLRTAFAAPPGSVDLSFLAGDPDQRQHALVDTAIRFAADLVHGHLIDVEDSQGLARHGLPVVLTVHNMRPGWPEGLADLQAPDAALLIACAGAVEKELRSSGLAVPIRTVWNGIDCAPFEPTPELQEKARRLRQQLQLDLGDFVLVALANPRPQKRLHLLPAILAATRDELARRGIGRAPRLILAGEASRNNDAASLAVEQVRDEIDRLGLRGLVRWTGPVSDVAHLLAVADVLVSTSAHEGLSLAHLEALAAGKAVVATDAGGTSELSRDNPAMTVLPLDSPPQRFAEVLADIAQQSLPSGREVVARNFTREVMAEQYARLYPRAIEAARSKPQGRGLWLVTNNFSTGGAQSSARRLLVALHEQGIPVRAVVLQEEADAPTEGRRRLSAAGIPVVALPPAGTIDPADAVATLLERIDADPPKAVLFWNALAEYKLLLADGLIDIPVFDVSPGEMYFTSLERYFARPRPGLHYRTSRDYGTRLRGVIVKYRAEAARAREVLNTIVHVIPNGVATGPIVPRAKPADGPLVIGTLARISPQKKLEELVGALRRAASRLPPHVMRIAGGVEIGADDYAAELRRQADGLAIEWQGDVQDIASFLGDLDLFVMVAEPAGCPNASLEAMAAGLAVIITDVGGAAEQVEDGVNGRLLLRGDVPALADALVELAGDPELRRRMGEAGRQRIEARFSLARMTADYRRVCLADGNQG